MKYVTNPNKNATVGGIDSSLRLMQARRTGEQGRVDPESLASTKVARRSLARREEIRSGKYFPNNVIEKQQNISQRAMSKFLETKQSIDSQRQG